MTGTGSAVKPPFVYFGGKTSTAERIAALLPAHRHYVEPFAGSLAVLLAKEPSKLETVNDLNRDLMTFWRVLRERPDELIAAAAFTPHSRAEYMACRDLDGPGDDLERARQVWVTLTQGRGGSFRKTGWRFYLDPNATGSAMTRYVLSYIERMPAAAHRLIGVSLECRDALDVIRDYGDQPEALIYADPPYLGSLRTWGNNYRHEMRDETSHRTLAEALHACKSAVVVSGYHSPLYDDLYDGWDRAEISAITGNAKPGAQRRTEVLWSNRPLNTTATTDALDFGAAS